MDEKMIPVQVLGIKKTVEHGFVVLLEEEENEEGNRILPIFIGTYEATAIDVALNGEEYPRPMTHDLMRNVLDETKIEIKQVEIVEVREQTYFADIILGIPKSESTIESTVSTELQEPGESEVPTDIVAEDFYRITARPSDAIALAVRVKCPIVVANKIMLEASFRASDLNPEGEETGGETDLVEGKVDDDMDEVVDQFKRFIEEVRPQDFDDSPPNS